MHRARLGIEKQWSHVLRRMIDFARKHQEIEKFSICYDFLSKIKCGVQIMISEEVPLI